MLIILLTFCSISVLNVNADAGNADALNDEQWMGNAQGSAEGFNATDMKIVFNANLNLTKTQICPDITKAEVSSQFELIQMLTDPCRYDRLQRPQPTTCTSDNEICPLHISTRVSIYSLEIKNSKDLTLQALGLMQLQYNDSRLAFNAYSTRFKKPIICGSDIGARLWLPKLALSNQQASSSLDEASKSISIASTGTVLISMRFAVMFDCWIDFQKFPLDEQYCVTTFQSWVQSTTDLLLNWAEDTPIVFHPTKNITTFNLNNYFPTQSIQISNASDFRYASLSVDYSALSLILILSRNLGFYVVSYFGPSIMIVANSWIAFWLQPDQTPARTILGTSTLLCLITLTATKSEDMPSMYYMKIAEIWFFICAFFIFSSLVEFAIVNAVWRHSKALRIKQVNFKKMLKLRVLKQMTSIDRKKSLMPETSRKPSNLDTISSQCVADIELSEADDCCGSKKETLNNLQPDKPVVVSPHDAALWIDRKARFYFPLAFLLFNAIYWSLVFTL